MNKDGKERGEGRKVGKREGRSGGRRMELGKVGTRMQGSEEGSC